MGSETLLEGLKTGRPKTSRLTTEIGNLHPGRASNGGFKRQGHQNEKQKPWRDPGRVFSSPEGDTWVHEGQPGPGSVPSAQSLGH